jgi:hypothetical protein
MAFSHDFSAAIEVAASLSFASAGAGLPLPRTPGKGCTAQAARAFLSNAGDTL